MTLYDREWNTDVTKELSLSIIYLPFIYHLCTDVCIYPILYDLSMV